MQQIIEFIQLHALLCLLWVVLLVAVIYSFVMPLMSKAKGISYQRLTQIVNKEDGVVFDIRSADQYRKGHISGAVNVPQSQLKSGPYAAYEKYQQLPVIVTCDVGNQAGMIARKLAKSGFEKVFYLQGGMNAWTGANLPLVKK
ncbi:rhodanese-like domain-containing protein [Celerinatantimonas diazotrophica]|uniref:Rhodanese-related sulfurtransferase n=1 Tax=Celerinatantimonas diazotrophica TaxID=412034 RepID=A0A4R1J8C1_9GAMM|nr:rhodanese-like domain-containing protein [Celerinatantimonas diazotrophica]TCK46812.1 rhodanese-related sulfurtransferase [Celerinatantimonas diazotrophica]CAG9295515.1 putative protein YibN [Celerinatantimonas diazotrophica]